jgi:hypothetical protein
MLGAYDAGFALRPLLPFRLAGIAVHAALELVRAVILLPVRIVRLGRGTSTL